MDQITNQIYIGSFQDAFSLDLLKEKNITAVLCVAAEIEDGYPWDIIYHHVPLFDCPLDGDEIDSPELLDIAVKSLETMIKSNHVVLVHCVSGISRSTAVVGVYLSRKDSISFDSAVKQIKRKRPKVDPSDEMINLSNKVLDMF